MSESEPNQSSESAQVPAQTRESNLPETVIQTDKPAPSTSTTAYQSPYQPSIAEKAVGEVKKRAPFLIARIIQHLMYGLFQVFQFLKQVVVDAFSH